MLMKENKFNQAQIFIFGLGIILYLINNNYLYLISGAFLGIGLEIFKNKEKKSWT